jgi:2-polyprenyl-6-methoxyphenol hydroxylase-like FAD-dependent oxidoreductase
MDKFITEPPKQLKVVLETDICVIGGSCTGLFAAVRASRLGARVAIVEKQNCFGGVAANAFVNIWHSLHDMDGRRQIIAGLTWETIQRLEKRRAVMHDNNSDSIYRMDTEELKIELDQMAVESKLSVFFHTLYTAPYWEDGELKGIIIENKDGRQVIRARFFIDASGDGDVARDIGLACYRHESVQPPSPGWKLLGDISPINISDVLQTNGSRFGLPEDWGWGCSIPGCPDLSFRADTHVFNVDCSKAAGLTSAEMEGRRQVRAVLDTLNRCSPDAVDLRVFICIF